MSKSEGAVRHRVENNGLLPALSEGATARDNCRQKIAELGQSAGFGYFLFAVFPRGDRTAFLGNCIASNWPRELLNYYEGCDVFHHSNLVARLKRTVMPVFCPREPLRAVPPTGRTGGSMLYSLSTGSRTPLPLRFMMPT
ncbi:MULTISPECIES: hypothetical protein [unclassified Sinorhizobium]|uniref:hypothetical protein n=1 Tax=unclassified Sinorhizobium TaxID=2613772 RepID=UPI0035268870